MKIIAIGDPHFKIKNVRETELMSAKIIELCNFHKPDAIVLLGDILDKHANIDVIPLCNAIELIKNLSEIAPVYVLIGNHDRPNNSDFLTGRHAFTALNEWKNITLADKVITANIKNIPLMFVPYVPPGRFQEAIDTVENNNPLIIFAHQEFKGAKMGAIVSEAGDVWSPENALIISGHIHDYQELQGNIIYTGTPIQHAFGDSSDKTISLLTINHTAYNIEIKNDILLSHKDCVVHDKLEMNLPKKKIVYLSAEQVAEYVLPEYNELKLVITGYDYEIKTLSCSLKIKQFLNLGIKISYRTIPKPNERISELVNSGERRKFLDVFQETIADDLELKKIYTELF